MSRLVYAPSAHEGPSEQRVMLATPVYGGLSAGYGASLFRTATALLKAGIHAELAINDGNCHVDDSRNFLVRRFLESDCTDFVFFDADLSWDGDDVVRLLRHDADVVGSTYRLKQFGDEAYPLVGAGQQPRSDGLIPVTALPTGFLRIRRHVLETMAKKSDKFHTKIDWPGQTGIPVIFERSMYEGVRWGGDTTFCRKWREMGGEVLLDPEPAFEHTGEYNWRGSFGTYMRQRQEGANGVIRDGLEKIRTGTEKSHTLMDLVTAWGNPMYAATEELLLAAIHVARNTTGPILEAGSGLTTLVMAAAAPGREVWAMEHDPNWGGKVQELAPSNVRLSVAPMKDYGEFTWYQVPDDLPKSFGMVMCDGPPRQTHGGRSGLRILLKNRISPGAGMVWDDADKSHAGELDAWSAETGAQIHVLGNSRRFAIARLPKRKSEDAT